MICGFLTYAHVERFARRHILRSAGAWKRSLGCDAFLVHAELLASQVGSPFRHQAVSHQLSASDCGETRHAVACLMVEKHDAAADVSSRRIIVAGNQRTHTRISAEDACRRQRRREFLALGEQNVDLIGSDAHIVNLVEAHAARCRTDKADCVARHEDIGVGRLAATIEHYIVNTVSEISNEPLAGNIPTRQPAIAAMLWPQIPPALMVNGAKYLLFP